LRATRRPIAWKAGRPPAVLVDLLFGAGMAKFAMNVCSPIPTKIPTKTDGCREYTELPRWSQASISYRKLSHMPFMRRENFYENKESNQTYNLLLLLVFSVWCPWPAIAEYHNHLKLKSLLSSVAADTSTNTSRMTRGIRRQK
jgi:hypothetical protein